MEVDEISRALKELSRGRPVAVRMVQAIQGQHSKMARVLEKEITELLLKQSVPIDRVRMSVSHTANHAESWVIVIGSDQKVGVDLERSTRTVHAKVRDWLLTDEEKELGMDVLKCWVAKEAAFKANPYNAGTFLSQYRMTVWDPLTQEGEILFPSSADTSLQCRFKVMNLEPWLIGLAHTFSSKGA